MEKSRSSTSSSDGRRRLLRDLLVAGLLLAAAEAYLSLSLSTFERQLAVLTAPAAGHVAPSNFRALGRQDPGAFLDRLRDLAARPVIVFLGDSQGADTHDGRGGPYPEEIARALDRDAPGTAVVSLHLVGSNAYEQGLMLLALLRGGVRPRAVVWAHNVFSQRKNEIRAELVPVYRELAPEMARLGPEVVLVGGGGAPDGGTADGAARLDRLATAWDRIIARSATVRFARRPLVDKFLILRRSPLGRLVPTAWLPGTAAQQDPPPALLRSSARFVGQVGALLAEQGVLVVNVLAPINRSVTPRPFSIRSEEVSYPALRAAVAAAGGRFLDLLDFLAPSHYGTYADGTPDAFHVDGAAHAAVAARLLTILEGEEPAP